MGDLEPTEFWIKRRNGIERAKLNLAEAITALKEVQTAGCMGDEDARVVAVARTSIETGLLWLDTVEE